MLFRTWTHTDVRNAIPVAFCASEAVLLYGVLCHLTWRFLNPDRRGFRCRVAWPGAGSPDTARRTAGCDTPPPSRCRRAAAALPSRLVGRPRPRDTASGLLPHWERRRRPLTTPAAPMGRPSPSSRRAGGGGDGDGGGGGSGGGDGDGDGCGGGGGGGGGGDGGRLFG